MDDYIRIPYWPEEHVKKAYSDGYFIEAIQVMHGFIELQLRELIFIQRKAPGPHDHFDLAVDTMYEITLSVAVKILFIQKLLSKQERDKLIQFNKTRNNIVHKIYYDSAHEGYRGYPRKEFDKAYYAGLDLMSLLLDRIHQFT